MTSGGLPSVPEQRERVDGQSVEQDETGRRALWPRRCRVLWPEMTREAATVYNVRCRRWRGHRGDHQTASGASWSSERLS